MKVLSDSLIRRYTPPTCTLEIWAKRSPLSFWSERQLVKELRFELRFDDPRLPTEEQISTRGDRAQIQQLGDVVGNYIQNFLRQTSFQIPVAVETLTLPSTYSPEARANEPMASPARPQGERNRSVPFPSSPALKPKGLLSHELSFGSLAVNSSKPAIELSVSQLFDLAEALEQFSAEIDTLPALDKIKKRKKTVIWASTATVALLAIGTAIVGTRIFQASERQAADIAASQREADSKRDPQSNLGEAIPPVPVAPTDEPIPSPTMPPSLKNRETLPPPPSVSEPTNSSRRTSVPPVLPPPPQSPSPSANAKPASPKQSTTAVSPESPKKAQPSSSAPSQPPTTAPNGELNLPTLPSLQSEPSSANGQTQSVSPSKPEADNTAPASTPNPTAYAPSAAAPPASSQATQNLLDTIPQVAEVRQYFQERWKAPEGLNQRLEYRLMLDREGAIARIVPLGRAANIYLDRTQMPLMGTPFVSPLETNERATIRLVLNPDGSVKTFLEE
ncbi:MAG: DUF4335 domain-containing protein [Hydrococcus sp. C42_A2020_068]|nr:DUF4335 domain-containing protein [Hydrococcus sp. C42_A2020_068]